MNYQHVSRVCLTHFLSVQDEILTVIRRVDENWAEGMLGDKIGIFPILYVEVNAQTLHLKQDGRAAAGDRSQWFQKPGQMLDDRKEHLIFLSLPFLDFRLLFRIAVVFFQSFVSSCLNSRSCWSTFNGRVVLQVSFLSLRLH